MKKCALRFVTVTAEGRSEFRAVGEYRADENGFSVTYGAEGDAATLVYADGELSMRRSGDVGLSARFREGAVTEFCMSAAGARGNVPVRTHLLQLKTLEKSLKLGLEYDLFFGNDPARFTLEMSLTESEEQ